MDLGTRTKDEKRIDHLVRLLKQRDERIAELEAQLADERTDRAGLRQACIENRALREIVESIANVPELFGREYEEAIYDIIITAKAALK